MRSRSLIAAATMAAIVAVAVNPAAAEERPTGGSGAYLDGGGNPTAAAQDGAGTVGATGGGSGGAAQGPPPPCGWRVVIEDDMEFNVYGDSLDTQHSRTGRWLQRVCEGLGAVPVDGAYLVPEGGLVDPLTLAEEALASIGIDGPAIRTSPSAEGRLYVQVPTWLWLDESWWQGYEATASAGRISSTVTARPTRTSWSLGDGTSLTCAGPGRAWQPGLPEDATDCAHIYRTSSTARPGGTFELSATVHFEIAWTSNMGIGGELPAISRSSSVPVEVGEIQAVGTR